MKKIGFSFSMFTLEDFWTTLTGIKTYEATEGTAIGDLPDGRAILVFVDKNKGVFRVFFCVNRSIIDLETLDMPRNENRREKLIKYARLAKALRTIANRNRKEG